MMQTSGSFDDCRDDDRCDELAALSSDVNGALEDSSKPSSAANRPNKPPCCKANVTSRTSIHVACETREVYDSCDFWLASCNAVSSPNL